MINILKSIQIFLAVAMVLFVLLQSKGQGLSKMVGNTFAMYSAKRGAERLIFILTNVFIFLFALNSLLILYFS